MKNIVFYITLLSLVFNCATIIKGGKQDFSIRTNQKGLKDAKYTLMKGSKEIDSGILPTQTKLATGDGYFSGAEYKIMVEAPGYEPKTQKIETSLRWGWYGLGNLLFGGAIGWFIVDPLTGAMYAIDVEDDEVVVKLVPTETPAATPAKKGK